MSISRMGRFALFGLGTFCLSQVGNGGSQQELVVYSSRNEHLIKPVFKAYQKKTGVKISYLTGKAPALVERLRLEGTRSRADLLLTVDAGNLWHAESKGLFSSIHDKETLTNIPSHLQSPQKTWIGLSLRARTIVYSTKRVKPSQLSTYEDLAEKKWQGKLCLRTSQKVYNQSLVGMMIARMGIKPTEKVVKGWVNNLARPVYSSDTKVIEAIVAGECDVGIVNSYYLGRLQAKDAKIPVQIFWANQKSTGVHVNISGIGITANSKNKKQATEFVRWLTQPEAQKLFAELNHEFPANKSVPASGLVTNWGKFHHDQSNLSKAGEFQIAAVKLMDRARYK